jgi:two-component system, NarL family, sensor histidine kinase BarA
MSLAASFLNQKIPLQDLLDLRSFAEVCHSFAELYRVGLKVFDEAGNKLVDVKVGNGDFCGYIWSKPNGREQCIDTVGRVKGDAVGEDPAPTTFQCFSGCRYVVQPILYEGDLMGRVVFGPFVPEDMGELPATLLAIATDLDPRLALSYLQKIRRVPVGTAEKILKHFMDLLDVMIFTGHKNLIAAKLHIEAVTDSYRELSEKNSRLEDS